MKKRKFGFGDILIIAIVGFMIFFIVRYAINASVKVKEVGFVDIQAEFYDFTTNDLRTEINIKSITFEGNSGEANVGKVTITGSYKDKSLSSNYAKFEGVITEDEANILRDYCNEIAKRAELGTLLTTQSVAREEALVSNFNWLSLISLIVPLALVVLLFVIMMRSNASQNNQAFDFAKSRARLASKTQITFKDVAGLDEEKEELVEVVDFLKNPAKYFEMGARIPKGILLSGGPGTGKTLLAKAVAGEANVPFYSISGSDFVEMFVGVGASRVRDMFKVAKQNAPCIVFIDEIDAVGRQRGTGLGGGHDEREQTLNQLLVEMDGFSGNSGIIVMAATNRVDILDPALLRPGRFDRHITVSNPDINAREAILKVHARNKKLSPRVNLLDVAKRTPGFSGADLENLLNEAALLAARENQKEIKIYHIDEAIDRVMMGPAKKSKKYTEEEKRMVAYHEAGHAVIGLKYPKGMVVQKVTIIPRGDAGGYNLLTPEKETYTHTKDQLEAEIVSYLGGRIAEEITFNEISDGAYDDIKRATRIARAMVTMLGMSNLGPVQYEEAGGHTFLGRDYLEERKISDQVAQEIDEEVRRIINESYAKGKKVIEENKELLSLLAETLIEVETLTREDISELMETGKLAWWEKKKAKAAKEAAETSEAEESPKAPEKLEGAPVEKDEEQVEKDENNEA